jgi:hypothetical protein
MSRASLETIIDDRSVCCGKDSALEHSLQRTDPMGVKEVAAKLQGRHLLSDGRAIEITAEYVDRSAVDSFKLISTLQHQQAAPPMEWNPHV